MTVRPSPLLVGLGAGLLLAGCKPAKPMPDNSLAYREVAAILERYQVATNTESPDDLAALYAPDAFLLPPDGGVVHGQEGIYRFWAEGLERGLMMDTLRVALDRDHGWVVGRYYLEGSDAAPPDSGKFVLALARHEGRWLVAADIWNVTPSEAEEENGDPRTRVLTGVDGRWARGPGRPWPAGRRAAMDHRLSSTASSPSPTARRTGTRLRSSR